MELEVFHLCPFLTSSDTDHLAEYASKAEERGAGADAQEVEEERAEASDHLAPADASGMGRHGEDACHAGVHICI